MNTPSTLIVSLEDFLTCQWEGVKACDACKGTGWVRCACGGGS